MASGPNVPTAWDSIDPGVRENKVCEAISGMNGPLNANLRSNAIDTAIAPAQSPATNDSLMEICITIIYSLSYLNQIRFKFFLSSIPLYFYVVRKKNANYRYLIQLL